MSRRRAAGGGHLLTAPQPRSGRLGAWAEDALGDRKTDLVTHKATSPRPLGFCPAQSSRRGQTEGEVAQLGLVSGATREHQNPKETASSS